MTLESTDFNSEYWSRFTEKEFIEQCVRDGIYKEYREQKELLTQAYQLIQDEIKRVAKKA